MCDLLVEPGTFALAQPTQEQPLNLGVKYSVPRERIVTAATALDVVGYAAGLARACSRNWDIRKSAFEAGLSEFVAVLKAHGRRVKPRS